MKKYQNSDFEQEDYEQSNQPQEQQIEETEKQEKYDDTLNEYQENGFKSYLIKYKNSPFFVPTITLLSLALVVVIILKFTVWTPGKLKNMKVDIPSIIYMGETQKITATSIGTGNLSGTTFHFDISNNSIVELESRAGKSGKTVDNFLIPISTGKFLLYVDASLNEKELERKEQEIVICKKMTNASIQKQSINVVENKKYQINLDLGKEEECYSNLTYTSQDENIATVDKNGLITAVSEGKTEIIIKNESTELNVEINVIKIVKEVKVTDITVEKNNVNLEIGMTTVITAKVLPDDATNKGLKWESSNNSVATVNNKGIIKGIGKGNATITVTTNDGDYKKSINVNIIKTSTEEPQTPTEEPQTPTEKPQTPTEKPTQEVKATSINLSKTTTTILVGKTETLSVMITPLNVTDKTITWTSENEKIATVKNGVITAKKVGITNIIAKTSNGKEAKVKVYVKSNGIPVTGIEILETEVLLPENDSKIIVATILPKNATNQNISWKSNDNSVATIRDGKITGVKEGTTTIIASTLDGNYKKEIKVTVIKKDLFEKDTTAPVLKMVSIKSNNPNPAIAIKGNSITLTIVADENLSSAPSVIINDKVVSVSGSNNIYTATYNVTEDINEEKEISFKITNYSDVYLNTGLEITNTTDNSKVTLKK